MDRVLPATCRPRILPSLKNWSPSDQPHRRGSRIINSSTPGHTPFSGQKDPPDLFLSTNSTMPTAIKQNPPSSPNSAQICPKIVCLFIPHPRNKVAIDFKMTPRTYRKTSAKASSTSSRRTRRLRVMLRREVGSPMSICCGM